MAALWEASLIFMTQPPQARRLSSLAGELSNPAIDFWDNSTAADSTIKATQGIVSFFGDSTAADSHITVSGAFIPRLSDFLPGGSAVGNCIGGMNSSQRTSVSKDRHRRRSHLHRDRGEHER